MPMEKQNTVENQLAHTITQTEFDSDYDKTAKKLLANKQILAQIMKGCVDECVAFFVKSSYGEKENSRRRVWRCNERRTGKRGAYYVQS